MWCAPRCCQQLLTKNHTQVFVPPPSSTCFVVPLEHLIAQLRPPTWLHAELGRLLADTAVQKVVHDGRMLGGVLQALGLTLPARMLDIRVLALQLQAMLTVAWEAVPDGTVAAAGPSAETALKHNGLLPATPSASGTLRGSCAPHKSTLCKPRRHPLP